MNASSTQSPHPHELIAIGKGNDTLVRTGNLGLADRVAIVTGGSRGIGKAVVALLASFGAHVVVNYLKDEEAAQSTVELAQSARRKGSGDSSGCVRPRSSRAITSETIDHFGRIDFLDLQCRYLGRRCQLSQFRKSSGTNAGNQSKRHMVSLSRSGAVDEATGIWPDRDC